jgi:hypothetical protein
MYGKRPGLRKFGRILREEEGEGKKGISFDWHAGIFI